MSDVVELVRRLRDVPSLTRLEAADTIEELVVENKRLKSIIDRHEADRQFNLIGMSGI